MLRPCNSGLPAGARSRSANRLVTQVVLGIFERRPRAGTALTQHSRLAGGFNVHPNTVSAGYCPAPTRDWVEFPGAEAESTFEPANQKRLRRPASGARSDDRALFRSAQALGVKRCRRCGRVLQQWLELQPLPTIFLLIEPDEELRRILAAEIARAVRFPVESLRSRRFVRRRQEAAFPCVANRGGRPCAHCSAWHGTVGSELRSGQLHFPILACSLSALVGVVRVGPNF